MMSWLLIGLSLGLIFLGCAVVVKKFFVDKKYFGGSQFVGRQIYEEFQNADRRECMEHIIHMEDEDRQQDFTADDNDDVEQGS